MVKHLQLALPNNPNQDSWSYYELFWINTTAFEDHLVIILKVSLADKSFIMNVYL